ncbi:mannonate dehydratase [Marivivens niveibacter]|uniref:Mannonate dehydratase n=1 Tax=Marivivens niveibacter TaxID=1930667 RepID=A0A251WVB0_9RHOB|nr:mannonate dehydratase [Marivivens niveibacter]OUD08419.1 mannonate dehydratase [Marivivens niveibacter]
MKQTWRWFGPNDPVSIDDMVQAGVQGVVTALHHLPPGATWPIDEIRKRQQQIAVMQNGDPSGLSWDVVESLPVSEDIKRQSGNFRAHIRAYCESLQNLKTAGIETVCYNFMPVLDWTRTDLNYRLKTGATCMRFDLIDFAAFDLFILQRDAATDDFDDTVYHQAGERFQSMSDVQRKQLSSSIVTGLPGAAENLTLDDVRERLATYDGISADKLRSHLIDFLSEVAPFAKKVGVRLCCHPDDPPFPLLGLPRVMSTEADYAHIMNAVDLRSNGITLCSGSLGARSDNDVIGMMDRWGDRVHFLHLRNVQLETTDIVGSFHEAEHLTGGTDMVGLMAAVARQESQRIAAGRCDWSIPYRPDHGQNILDDHGRPTQPGYPAIGRLKGLAELRGIQAALTHSQFGKMG